MNEQCNQCSGPMQLVHGQSHLTCYDCNTYHFPTSGLAEPATVQCTGKQTDFQCPKCLDQALQVGMILNTQVATCVNCRGFVVDSNSFGHLAIALRQQYQGPEDTPVMVDQHALSEVANCPACLNPMHSHPYHGPGNAVINSCIGCQLTWLDHGELGTIIRAPGQRYSGTSAPHESELLRSKFNQQAMQGRYRVRNTVGQTLFDLFGDL